MDMPRSKGRPRKNRIKKVLYLDPGVVDAVKDFGNGNDSDAVNMLIRRAVKVSDAEPA